MKQIPTIACLSVLAGTALSGTVALGQEGEQGSDSETLDADAGGVPSPLSLHDYYQDASGNDDTFGFFQAGVKASVPLPFGDRYGKWSLNAGIYGLFLGDNTAA